MQAKLYATLNRTARHERFHIVPVDQSAVGPAGSPCNAVEFDFQRCKGLLGRVIARDYMLLGVTDRMDDSMCLLSHCEDPDPLTCPSNPPILCRTSSQPEVLLPPLRGDSLLFSRRKTPRCSATDKGKALGKAEEPECCPW